LNHKKVWITEKVQPEIFPQVPRDICNTAISLRSHEKEREREREGGEGEKTAVLFGIARNRGAMAMIKRKRGRGETINGTVPSANARASCTGTGERDVS